MSKPVLCVHTKALSAAEPSIMPLENIEETIDKRLERLRLHYQIIKIEYDHWTTEVAQLRTNHQREVERLQSSIQPMHKKRAWRCVMMALDRLCDAEEAFEKAKFNLQGTASYIQFLEKEQLKRERETDGGDFAVEEASPMGLSMRMPP